MDRTKVNRQNDISIEYTVIDFKNGIIENNGGVIAMCEL